MTKKGLLGLAFVLTVVSITLVFGVMFTACGAVYIVGTERGESHPDAVYWKNGKRTVLPKEGDSAYVTAIDIKGNDIYITGNDSVDVGYLMPDLIPVYWKNGEKIVLPTIIFPTDASNSAEANAIAIKENDVYIAGLDGGEPVYWKNGERIVLPKGGNLLVRATAIAIKESDVYIAGTGYGDGTDAVYWKNGERTVLPKEGKFAQATAIAIK